MTNANVSIMIEHRYLELCAWRNSLVYKQETCVLVRVNIANQVMVSLKPGFIQEEWLFCLGKQPAKIRCPPKIAIFICRVLFFSTKITWFFSASCHDPWWFTIDVFLGHIGDPRAPATTTSGRWFMEDLFGATPLLGSMWHSSPSFLCDLASVCCAPCGFKIMLCHTCIVTICTTYC